MSRKQRETRRNVARKRAQRARSTSVTPGASAGGIPGSPGPTPGLGAVSNVPGSSQLDALGLTGNEPDAIEMADRYLAQGRLREARQVYVEITKAQPNVARAWVGAGLCTLQLGNFEAGLKCAQHGVELDDRNPHVVGMYANMLYTVGLCDESLKWAERAAELDPANDGAHGLVARNLEQMQRIDEGIAHLQAVVENGKATTYIFATLGHLYLRQKKYDEARAAIEPVRDDQAVPAETRLMMLNDLANIHDRRKEYDHAFELFVQCGLETERSRLAAPFNRERRYTLMAALRDAFTPEVLRRWSGDDFRNERPAPAFLVGFPRSGTTMTEQVLGAHPGVSTSGELTTITEVGAEFEKVVGASHDLAAMVRRLSVDGARHLRRFYWKSLEKIAHVDTDTPVYLDKLPLNIVQLGLINLVFPDARVIVALRDPRDVCLSCLFQNFMLNNAMIHFLTLESTVKYYSTVMDLYLHQRDMLSLDVIEVRYEDTVTDLEAQARRMFDHLALPWDDRVLQFHQKSTPERYINTPSYAAVTEPVHRGAVARWKNYESHIASAIPMLQRFIDAFGYRDV